MQTTTIFKALSAALLLSTGTVYAQDPLNVVGGGSMGKKVVVPKIENLAVAQATVYFKLATTKDFAMNERNALGGRKSGGSSVSGRLTAYLETTDGELTEADYQEVADGFYAYLNKKLSSSGIPTVGWDKIKSADFFQKAMGDEGDKKEKEKEQQKGQIWVEVNANKGSTMYNFNPFGGINPAFAFGKINKAAKFSDEMDAPIVLIHVTVDFADIALSGDVRTGESIKWGFQMHTITKSKNFKFDAQAGAHMKVPPAQGTAYFFNKKSQGDFIVVAQDISSQTAFANNVSQDPEKAVLKKPIFYVGKDFKATPVVIETTRAQYKAAAAKALERYADAFVQKIKASSKD